MHKLIEASVLAAIGVLVFAALLIPVVDDATATTEKLTNTGYYTMDKLDNPDDYVLSWDYSEPKTITVNGTKINMDNRGLVAGKTYTVFGSDNFVLRLYWTANNPLMQCFGDQNSTPSYLQATVDTSSTLTATISNGQITFSTTNTTYPNDMVVALSDSVYCINPADTGDYVMKKSNESVYIESNTDIIVLDGISTLAASDVGIYADGTINGDLDAVTFRGTSTYDVTFSDWEYTTTDVSGYIDLVKLEKVDFVATQNDNDYDVTYSYFIVPATVTAEKAVHADEPTRDILAVLPLILICALIMGVVGYAVYSRIE